MTNIYSKTKLLGVKPMVTYFMDQLKLRELFEKYIPKTPKMLAAPADALLLMIFNIITSPNPLYKISEWAADYLDGIGEQSLNAENYNDDCLGRNTDRLFKCDRNSLMLDVSANAVTVHSLMTDILRNDSTSITFKGRYENQLPDSIQLRHGHNKDFRPDCLQLVYGLNITDDGNVPLSFQLFDGSQTDDETHIPNWENLRQMLNRTDFIYAADCKLCSEDSLDHIHKNEGFFVTVVPRNRTILNPFKQQSENGEVQWEPAYSVQDNRKPSEQNHFCTFESNPAGKGYRLIWILSTAKTCQDKKTRERRLAKAENNLNEIAGKLNRCRLKTRNQIETAISQATKNVKGLIDIDLVEHRKNYRKKVGKGRPGPNSIYKNCTRITYELNWRINQAAVDQQSLSDGTFPLITNTDKQCADVLRICKQQPRLEKRFNTTKSVLETAPVFLKKSSRIEAVMFLYFVALMVISLMERAIRKQMAEDSIENLPILPRKMKTSRPAWNNLKYFFRNVHLSQIFIKERCVNQMVKGLHDVHFEVLRLLGIPPSVYFNRDALI